MSPGSRCRMFHHRDAPGSATRLKTVSSCRDRTWPVYGLGIEGEGASMTASVIGAVAAGSTAIFRSWMARFRFRAASLVTGGVGEAAVRGVTAAGREHPASRHTQATSRVIAIFFMIANSRKLEGAHFLRGHPIEGGHRGPPSITAIARDKSRSGQCRCRHSSRR
ncbi:MAG: hypothetical protein QOE26_1070 [Verrucomicrobiota bacterium]